MPQLIEGWVFRMLRRSVGCRTDFLDDLEFLGDLNGGRTTRLGGWS